MGLERQKFGTLCNYCKSQGLPYDGHWISTCPIIRKLAGLPPPPPPMTSEPAIRAVNTERAESVDDTGSQVHVSGCLNNFSSLQPLDQSLPLSLVSPSALVHATHRGTMKMPWTNAELKGVLFCKEINGTLVSLGQLINQGLQPNFRGNNILVLDGEDNIFLFAKFCNNTWTVSDPLKNCKPGHVDLAPKTLICAITKNNSYDWHCRLGHASNRVCQKALGEHYRHKIKYLMVTDVMGPISQVDIHGNKYLLTLRDHASTFVFCFPLKSRDQVTKVLTDTLKLIQNVFKSLVKFIRSDNAKEYKENNFNVHLISMGTQQIFTSPYTPEQNGEAERLNRTLGDAARKMLRASGMPLTFWSYAYKVAAYIHNQIPNTKTGDKTPLELWCGRQPQAHRLHSFGAKAIVHIPAEKRGKLEDRGRVCKLVGFQDDSRGFFFWDEGNKAIINSNHV
ncbi:hypothetical protein O181_089937 [Austropuccinia psidii MF-1]|uniref:Integrase catalytic domain-containing protein n=1 Tax=Austropuccinia psidii MF-1 TaxID=1389203 RepID=A0A9Q3P774_9BASI|nr:hypothetical protein [Austropuccinia psidii MF-1]